MSYKCHNYVLSDDIVCIRRIILSQLVHSQIWFFILILAEQVIEERSRSKKRAAKGKGSESGEIKTKPEEKKEEDEEASRS